MAGQRIRVDQQWPADLTEREVEVLRLAARGHSNRAIADGLFISENTVKTRLFYARKKLAELLKAAGIERGWP